MTTHDKLGSSAQLATDLEKLLSSNTNTKALETKIGEALARLDYHKKTGQNFLGSENKDVAEKEYQTIYRLVLT